MKRSLFLLLALSVLGLGGCASVSVQKDTEDTAAKMPQKIYISFFEAEDSAFKVDRTGPELAAFKQHLQAMMQAGMVADLSHRLILAVPAGALPGAAPESAWLIQGEFTRVNQGSRLLRGAIGLGAGRTRLETRVYVYDLSQGARTPFLTFLTAGGSGAEPARSKWRWERPSAAAAGSPTA